MVEANGGNISVSGVYTAPPTSGTYHVKAVSASDPLKSATAVVTVTAAPQSFPLGTWVGPDGVSVTISQLVVNGGDYGRNQFFGSVTFLGKTIAINSLTDPFNFIQGRCIYPFCGDKRTERTDGYLVGASDLTSATPVGGIVIGLDTGASNTQMTGGVDIIKWNGDRYSNGNAIFTLQ